MRIVIYGNRVGNSIISIIDNIDTKILSLYTICDFIRSIRLFN